MFFKGCGECTLLYLIHVVERFRVVEEHNMFIEVLQTARVSKPK